MVTEEQVKKLISWALKESCGNNYESGMVYGKREMYYKGYAQGVSDLAAMLGIVIPVYFEAMELLKSKVASP